MTVLFWAGLSKNMHTTILKGTVGGFEDNKQLSPEGEGWIEVNIIIILRHKASRYIHVSGTMNQPWGGAVLVFSQLNKNQKGTFWKLKTLFS